MNLATNARVELSPRPAGYTSLAIPISSRHLLHGRHNALHVELAFTAVADEDDGGAIRFVRVDALFVVEVLQGRKKLRRGKDPIEKQAFEEPHHFIGRGDDAGADVGITRGIQRDTADASTKFCDHGLDFFFGIASSISRPGGNSGVALRRLLLVLAVARLGRKTLAAIAQRLANFMKGYWLEDDLVVSWVGLSIDRVDEGLASGRHAQGPQNSKAATN